MTKWQAQCARSASLCTGQPTADFPRPGVRVPQLPPRRCAPRRPGVQNLLCNCTYNEYLL